MSDSSRNTEEMTILAELGQRARAVVEELARSTKSARSRAAESDRAPSYDQHAGGVTGSASEATDASLLGVHRRLEEIRTCIDEVTDVLEAAVERLESVELQLGDPSEGVERQLSDGIQRCERVLAGIEHRVVRAARPSRRKTAASASRQGASAPAILVVASESSVRSRICLGLERQGFRAVAVTGLGAAVRMADANTPVFAVLAVAGPEVRARLLEDWKEHEERGSLPRAAVLDSGDASDAPLFGFALIQDDHGEAALAASLMDLIHSAEPGARS